MAHAQTVRSINMDAPGLGPTGTYSFAPSSYSGLSNTAGTDGSNSTGTVGGVNISNSTSIAFPAGYVGSLTAVGGFGNPISVPANSFSAGATVTIFFHLLGTNTAGTYNGNISISSTGATTKTVAVTGSTAGATTPTLTTIPASPLTLTGFATTHGTASIAQTYQLSGANLTGAATVTPPVGYEMGTNGSTFPGNSGSPISLSQSGGSLVGQPVTLYTRLQSTASVGVQNGNITNATTGGSNVLVALQGNVSTVGSADTIDINPWDSIKNVGKGTDPTVNYWAPVGAPGGGTAGLSGTSANLKTRAGTQTGISVSIDNVNDYHQNVAGWGTGNSTGFPASDFGIVLFNTITPSTLTIKGFTGVFFTSINVQFVSSVDVGNTNNYLSIFTSGSATDQVNSAASPILKAPLLSNLTPDGSGNIPVTLTYSGSGVFNIIGKIRVIINH